MSDRYTMQDLEQAFHAYWHAKTRFLKVADTFCKQQESKDEVEVVKPLEKALGERE